MHIAFLLTFYYPFFMAAVFVGAVILAKVPGKGRLFSRAAVALTIALLLAHANRVFYFWPAHPWFVSGHMTTCFGLALSLGSLRPWTLAITLPLLVPFGIGLVACHFHTPMDVLGAFPLVLVVYGLVHWSWPSPPTPPLDSHAGSL
jgi:membrane-associated phospholipid phosphatase